MPHQLAKEYFSCRQFWLFMVPLLVLTFLGSILLVVKTSAVLEEETQTFITITIGSIAAFLVFLTAMDGVCSYGTRAKEHDSAFINLTGLLNELVTLKDDPSQGDTVESIQSRYRNCLDECKSIVPIALSGAFKYLRVALSNNNQLHSL